MKHNITVYSTTTCPYCTMVKSFLSKQGLNYTDINLEEKPQYIEHLIKTTGQLGVPQTEINGEWVIGFDPQQILQLINKK